jgi:hypothetical protein
MGSFGHDFEDLVEVVRADRNLAERLRPIASALWFDGRRGAAPWVNYGPRQLHEAASDRKRAREDVYARVNGIAVLPKAQRPLFWALAIDPHARLSGGSTAPLPGTEWDWERLTAVVGERLYPGRRIVSSADAKFLDRALASTLAPAIAPMVTINRWISPRVPVLDRPVSINATTAAREHVWEAQPSCAGFPVLGRLASLEPMMVMLDGV